MESKKTDKSNKGLWNDFLVAFIHGIRLDFA